jgi:hypothetical protein
LVIGTCSPCVSQDSTSARSTKLAERFNFFCLQSVPDFLSIAGRSSDLKLKVIEDRTIPAPDGEKFYQKNWLVQDPTGEFVLLSEDVKGPKHVIGCGIAAHDADGPELVLSLSKDERLGEPVSQGFDNPDAGKTVWWEVQFGSETAQVMLAYDNKVQPGIVLNLIYRKDN